MTTDSRKWKSVRWIGLTLILFAIVMGLLPFAIRLSLTHWMQEQGLSQASIDSVDFNPFTGHLVIHDLEGHLPSGLAVQLIHAELKAPWSTLFKKHILIDHFNLTDAELLISADEGQFQAAGIDLRTATEKPTQPKEQTAIWQIGIKNLAIQNTLLRLEFNQKKQDVLIQSLKIQDIFQWQPQQYGQVQLALLLDDNSLELKSELSPFALNQKQKAHLEFQFKSYPKWFNSLAETHPFDGHFGGNWQIEAHLDEFEHWHIHSQGQTVAQKVDFQQPVFSLDELNHQHEAKVNWSESSPAFSIKMDLSATGLNWADSQTDVSIQEIALKQLNFDEDLNYLLQSLSAKQIKLNQAQSSFQTSAIHSLELEEIELNPKHKLHIKKSMIGGFNQNIVSQVQNQGQNLESTATDANSTEAHDSETQDTTPNQPFQLILDHLAFTTPGQIHWQNTHQEPGQALIINIPKLQLNHIDNQDPDQTADLELEATLNQVSKLALSGHFKPIFPEPEMHLAGKISALDMTLLNDLAIQNIGYSLQQGILNAEITAKVDQGELDMENKLTLLRLRVKPVESAPNKLNAPLESGLAMLRNAQDEIKLTIPVKGRYHSPDFDTSDVIRQALVKAVSTAGVSYLAYALQPYGALLAAGKLAKNIQGKTPLEALSFQPGETELTSEQIEFLEKLSNILKDRPKLTLLISPSSHTLDQLSLPSSKNVQKQFTPEPDSVSESESRLDQTLSPEENARKRAQWVQNFLIESGIDSQRIVISQTEMLSDTHDLPELAFSL